MKVKLDCGIIGLGKIGRGLYDFLSSRHSDIDWSIRWIARSDGIYNTRLEKIAELNALFGSGDGSRKLRKVDVVFSMLPTVGNGRVAYRYLKTFLHEEVPIVTAEKAAVAFHHASLQRYSHLLRYNAALPAGILQVIRDDGWGIVAFDGAINATFNRIRELVFMQGFGVDAAIQKVKEESFMESESLIAELRDVFIKGALLFAEITGESRAKEIVSSVPSLEQDFFAEILQRGYLCTVTIARPKQGWNCGVRHHYTGYFWAYRRRFNGWIFQVCFEDRYLLPFAPPRGPNNAFFVMNALGQSRTVSAEGAGVRATIATVYSDARELLCLRNPRLLDCAW